jgi:hypothetical protein
MGITLFSKYLKKALQVIKKDEVINITGHKATEGCVMLPAPMFAPIFHRFSDRGKPSIQFCPIHESLS